MGVADRGFRGINPLVPDLWLPFRPGERAGVIPRRLDDPANRFIVLHARLRAGITTPRATAELSALLVDPPARAGSAIHVVIGATWRDVLRLIVRDELRLVLWGIAAGLAFALGEAKLLGIIVVPLSPIGFGTIGALAAGLLLVAALATTAPSLAALRIAPMRVLRQD